ncbi:uncharacterized protein LOC116169039 [Photinus pyralis]|nr:uncharacterized protein LOC116169039 [Photinus pyralis]
MANNNDASETNTPILPPSTSTSVTSTAIEKITVKPPVFWEEDPALWFKVVEAQFELSRITADTTKYFTIVAALSQKALKLVSDIITSPPENHKFDTLRNALISRLTESEDTKLQKLLRDLDLGDRKPTQLLREMKTLSGTSISNELLKKLWLQRLPQQVQVVLAISSESLDNLAIMADKIVETYSNSVVTEVATREVQSNSSRMNTYHETDLDKKLEEFKRDIFRELNKLRGHKNPIPRNRSKSRTRERSNATPPPEGLCYYHRRFAERAKKCTKPCAFETTAEN